MEPSCCSPKNRFICILTGLVLIAIFTAVGFLLGKYSAKSKTPLIPQITPIPTETVYTEQSRSANWKTYTNEKYQYSFNYPSNLNIQDKSMGEINQFEILGQQNRKIIVNITKMEEQPYYLDTPSLGKIGFGNLTGEKYILPNGYCDGPECSPPIIAAVVFNNGTRYVFSVQGDTTFNEAETLILSTFKFLD